MNAFIKDDVFSETAHERSKLSRLCTNNIAVAGQSEITEGNLTRSNNNGKTYVE